MISFYGRAPVVLASAAALAVVSLGVTLGSWQLRRAEEKATLQLAQDQAQAASPIALATLRSVPGGAADVVDGLRVQASGVFEPGRTVFLDNRTREGVAGFHVLTPLKLAGGQEHVMVLRGWVARDLNDRNRLPPVATPTQPVSVVGLAVASLPQPMMLAKEPTPGPEDRLWQHFEYRKFSQWAGISLYPVVLRQTVEPDYPDGLARDWNQPGLSVDRHRGYAFQWFAMTAAALLTWAAMLWRFKSRNAPATVAQAAGR